MKKGGKTPSSLLESQKIREILREGSEALLISADDDTIEKAAQLIESLRDDLVKIMNMPLKDVELFRTREHLTLNEIESFYEKLKKELQPKQS